MKKLLFIFLISFSMQSFAQTFVCADWRKGNFNPRGKVIKGTMFVGEKRDNGLTIKRVDGTEEELILLGKDISLSWEYYTNSSYEYTFDDSNTRFITSIFGLQEWLPDPNYDFVIAEFIGIFASYHTLCNYQ